MTHPANALQAAIYTRLAAQLSPTPVYDHVPQGSDYPYVVIGADTLLDDSTKDKIGWNATVTVHIWDKPAAGRKTVKTVMGQIYDALNRQEASVPVTGFALVSLLHEFDETYQDTSEEGNSDHYYHGVMRFRALIKST